MGLLIVVVVVVLLIIIIIIVFVYVKNNNIHQMAIIAFYSYNLIILISKLCVQKFVIGI